MGVISFQYHLCSNRPRPSFWKLEEECNRFHHLGCVLSCIAKKCNLFQPKFSNQPSTTLGLHKEGRQGNFTPHIFESKLSFRLSKKYYHLFSMTYRGFLKIGINKNPKPEGSIMAYKVQHYRIYWNHELF